jgi:hypothetical protein
MVQVPRSLAGAQFGTALGMRVVGGGVIQLLPTRRLSLAAA